MILIYLFCFEVEGDGKLERKWREIEKNGQVIKGGAR